ncbi:hypothetical protein HK097_010807 [Rhizophlyctis rosea]|uniref:Uncharacterized protein n=1 Tax=Rhizophlyctis rosea TaxID=64517 RepID=A0AAD5X3H8_9FUNG|nr:hypothetical protein HK097_010807 [Rhizophlyctis rosea]
MPNPTPTQLYRRCLRAIRLHSALPIDASPSYPTIAPKAFLKHNPFQHKLHQNVRTLFDLYRDEQSPKVISEAIEMGVHDVGVLEALADVEKETRWRRGMMGFLEVDEEGRVVQAEKVKS